MSVGNINSYGDKKNNFTWQIKVLEGLQAIANNTDPDCCLSTLDVLNDILTIVRGEARTPGILSTTGPGATPVGAYSLSFANVGSAPGVINGMSIPAGVTIKYDGGMNNTLDPMSYNATGTTFLITYVL